MIYVVDTCVFKHMLNHIYFDAFSDMWNQLDYMFANDVVSSVKEVYNELVLQFSKNTDQLAWINKNRAYFHPPTLTETHIVKLIFQNQHYQQSIPQRSLLNGNPVADPFLVARAKALSATLVTREIGKDNSAKIPTICDAFCVQYIGENEFIKFIRKNS